MVFGILLVLAGLSLALYGSLFYRTSPCPIIPPAVVFGILLVLAGLSLALYGGLFYMTVREPVEYEMPLERHRREQQMFIYKILLFAGIPVMGVGVLLWIIYLFRTGRCRYCPLCPGAKKRRRRREEFEAQVRGTDSREQRRGIDVWDVSGSLNIHVPVY